MSGLRVEGFLAAGVRCGLKREGLDLGLIRCLPAAACAGLFTTNRVKAAPVLLSQERVRSGRCAAVLVNSGNANACTGRRGLDDARALSARVAELLGVGPEEVARMLEEDRLRRARGRPTGRRGRDGPKA